MVLQEQSLQAARMTCASVVLSALTATGKAGETIRMPLQGAEPSASHTLKEIICPGMSYATSFDARSGAWLDAIDSLTCSNGDKVEQRVGGPGGGSPWNVASQTGFTSIDMRWFQFLEGFHISWVKFPGNPGYGEGKTSPNGGASTLSCPLDFVIAGLQAHVNSQDWVEALGLICRPPNGRAVIRPRYGK